MRIARQRHGAPSVRLNALGRRPTFPTRKADGRRGFDFFACTDDVADEAPPPDFDDMNTCA